MVGNVLVGVEKVGGEFEFLSLSLSFSLAFRARADLVVVDETVIITTLPWRLRF